MNIMQYLSRRVQSEVSVYRHTINLRAILIFSVALFSAVVLVACSNEKLADDSSVGGSSAAETEDPRIVALDWRYEEILHALDLEPVGIVEIGQSKAPATLEGKLDGIESVGQAKQPNLEVIQSLEPDLILASPTRHAAIMDQLAEIAPTESYSDDSYVDVLDAMDEIAAKYDRQDKAQEVRNRIETKVEKARDVVPDGTRSALIGWTKDTLYTWVDPSFPASLLTAAGYEYGYQGEKSAIESKTDVAELTGDKLSTMELDTLFLYNDQEAFHNSPWADVVDDVVDVEQDTWSRSRGPIAAEVMLDKIIDHALQK